MRSRIMKRAHELAKQSNLDYREAFSMELKNIYWMIKHEDQIQSSAWTA